MLKHVSNTMLRRRRTVSPAPSSTSISTLDSGSSSASSTCSSPSTSSCLSSGQDTSSSSSGHGEGWPILFGDYRALSRLSIAESPLNAVPLRIYAACLRPDIQYKTIGVTSNTTCEDVIGALIAKSKVRFKDPRLFQIVMEVEIRCPDGCTTRASIKLEDRAIPLQLQECYPRGQAKFLLEMKSGILVKIFDETRTVGWEYKSVLISEKTTAGELVDILFRFTSKNSNHLNYYSIHLEGKDWRRGLEWTDLVIPSIEGSPDKQPVRILLRTQRPFSTSSFDGFPIYSFLRSTSSTLSLYDNLTSPKYSGIILSYPTQHSSQITTLDRHRKPNPRKDRNKFLFETLISPPSSLPTSTTFSSDDENQIGSEVKDATHLHSQLFIRPTSSNPTSPLLLYGKYELSEAFFV